MGDTDISMSLDNEEPSDIDMMDSSDIAHNIHHNTPTPQANNNMKQSSFDPRKDEFIPSPAFQSSPGYTPSQKLRYANARKINNKDPPYMEFFEKENERRRLLQNNNHDINNTPSKATPASKKSDSPLQHIFSAAKTVISSPGRLGAKLGKASRENHAQGINNKINNSDNNDNTLVDSRWDPSLIGDNSSNDNQLMVTTSRWFARHEAPVLLSSYLHVFMRLVYVLVFTYVILSCVYMIHRDVSRRIDKQISEVVQMAKQCTEDYIANRCMQERIPANRQLCEELEHCRITNDRSLEMLEKHTYDSISRSRMLAETYASILDSFVNGMSYKTMIFVLLVLYGCIFASNFTFGFVQARWGGSSIRSNNNNNNEPPPYMSTPARPPSTPHHHHLLLDNNSNAIDWNNDDNNNNNNNNNNQQYPMSVGHQLKRSQNHHYSGSLYSMGGTPVPAMARANSSYDEIPDSMVLSRRNFVK